MYFGIGIYSNVPSLCIAAQPMLSLLASGRTTGFVWDCGYGVSHVVAVVDGYLPPSSIISLDITGDTLTGYMHQLLNERLNNSNEIQISNADACDIKEKRSFVSLSYDNEVADNTEDHQLPDGRVISLDRSKARFQCPEALFQPMLIGLQSVGIHTAIFKSIKRVFYVRLNYTMTRSLDS